MPPVIAIAMSGGIDSLVAAAILKKQGNQVFGLHFLTGFEPALQKQAGSKAPSPDFHSLADEARRELTPMVDQLEIPLHIIDLRTAFKKEVIDYFVTTYQAGRTPNPCLKCNPAIKFGHLIEKARQLGATQLATGHYAQLKSGPNGRMRLFRGVDAAKDQSYFLGRLSQAQLKSAVLPLGGQTKSQTRQMAREMGLQAATAPESQDICFIQNGTYSAFLKQQPGFSAQPGPIVALDGRTLGHHSGLHHFTIGQRRGINCPASEPYYVVQIDAAQNRLVVGWKSDLEVSSFMADDINWIAPVPESPIQIKVRVRYRHQAVPATLKPLRHTKAEIIFHHPQPAVTPGQGAVFYNDDEVLGAGWIQ